MEGKLRQDAEELRATMDALRTIVEAAVRRGDCDVLESLDEKLRETVDELERAVND